MAEDIVAEPTEVAEVPEGLSGLFAETWKSGKPEETPEGDNGTHPEPAETPAPKVKAVEKPAIVHEDLPPAELTGGTPAKTEEVTDDFVPSEPPPEIKGKVAREQFKVLETKLHEANKRLKSLESAPPPSSAAQPDQASQARIVELEGQLAQLSSTADVRRLQSQQKFQQEVIGPRMQAVEKAKNFAAMADVDPQALERAIHMNGRAKIEALDEIIESIPSAYLRQEVTSLVKEIGGYDEKAQSWLANAKSTNEQWEAESRVQQQEQMKQQEHKFKALLSDVSQEFEKQGIVFAKKIPGNDKWNAQVDAMDREAEELLLRNTDERQLIAAAKLSTYALPAIKWAMRERELRIAEEKKNAEFEQSTPKLGGRTASVEGEAEAPSGAAAILARAWNVKK